MTDISEFNKDQLKEFALTLDPPLDLDLRKSLSVLRKQVQDKLVLQPEVKNDPPPRVVATHIKNTATGFVFVFTPALKAHFKENGVLCDADGNEV